MLGRADASGDVGAEGVTAAELTGIDPGEVAVRFEPLAELFHDGIVFGGVRDEDVTGHIVPFRE